MRNFDYLKDIEQLHDLYIFCQAAESMVFLPENPL